MYIEEMNQPTPKHPFKSKSFFHSLGYALNGLKTVLQTERNFRTHTVLTITVIVVGVYYHVSLLEWGILLLCITLMLAVEALNTAIEYLVDLLAGGVYNEQAKAIKDIAAGACLVTATGTAITGLLIFLPHFLNQP